MQSLASTGCFSNSTSSSVTNCRFSLIIARALITTCNRLDLEHEDYAHKSPLTLDRAALIRIWMRPFQNMLYLPCQPFEQSYRIISCVRCKIAITDAMSCEGGSFFSLYLCNSSSTISKEQDVLIHMYLRYLVWLLFLIGAVYGKAWQEWRRP